MRYIRQKQRFAQQVEMQFTLVQLPSDISETDLLQEMKNLSNNPEISGYIVQLPLPDHIDTLEILRHINPQKDVDGFHPENQGKVVI